MLKAWSPKQTQRGGAQEVYRTQSLPFPFETKQAFRLAVEENLEKRAPALMFLQLLKDLYTFVKTLYIDNGFVNTFFLHFLDDLLPLPTAWSFSPAQACVYPQ